MSDWKTFSKNNIASRDWTNIQKSWAAAIINFEYGSVDSLDSVILGYVGDEFAQRNESSVFSFPGGGVTAFHDAMSSILRGAYILEAVRNCLSAGQPTWAALDAYHCSLVLCRAALGLLGICFVRIKDTNCVVDIFPMGSTRDAQKKFRREFGTYSDPARLFFRKRGSLIEQSGIWALLVRTLRVAVLPSSLDGAKEVILRIEEGFGRGRNDILYTNQSWPYISDNQWPLSILDLNDDIFTYPELTDFFTTERDANLAFCKLMVILITTLLNDVRHNAASALLPSFYTPRMEEFVGFGGKLRVPAV